MSTCRYLQIWVLLLSWYTYFFFLITWTWRHFRKTSLVNGILQITDVISFLLERSLGQKLWEAEYFAQQFAAEHNSFKPLPQVWLPLSSHNVLETSRDSEERETFPTTGFACRSAPLARIFLHLWSHRRKLWQNERFGHWKIPWTDCPPIQPLHIIS